MQAGSACPPPSLRIGPGHLEFEQRQRENSAHRQLAASRFKAVNVVTHHEECMTYDGAMSNALLPSAQQQSSGFESKELGARKPLSDRTEIVLSRVTQLLRAARRFTLSRDPPCDYYVTGSLHPGRN